jgi:hypothetical protein
METRIETMADGTIYSFPGIGMVKEENPKAGNGAIYLEAYMHAPSLLSGCHPPCLTFVPYNSPCPWLAPQAAILSALPVYPVTLSVPGSPSCHPPCLTYVPRNSPCPWLPKLSSYLPYLCTP